MLAKFRVSQSQIKRSRKSPNPLKDNWNYQIKKYCRKWKKNKNNDSENNKRWFDGTSLCYRKYGILTDNEG